MPQDPKSLSIPLFLLAGVLAAAGLFGAPAAFRGQVMLGDASSAATNSSSVAQCTPARILYFNLQPSMYGRDAELSEFREVKALGFDITLANRNSIPTITKGIFDIYNVLWLHGGCAGEAFPLKAAEIGVIRDHYLNGGSLIIDAGDNYAGGIYGPAGANCQTRANQIANNVGVNFSGRIQYAASNDSCRAIQTSDHPLLKNVEKVFRESSGEMQLLSTVSWGRSKPFFVGSIDATGAPVLAAIAKEAGHGGVIFSPQDQGLQIRCSGQGGQLYKNIFMFLGHELNCREPESTEETAEIPGTYCHTVTKKLYGSGAVRVTCPADTVVMSGGWDNGDSELNTYSRPLEIGQGWECRGNKEDVNGKCMALCCDSYHYETVVMDRSGPQNNQMNPYCPQGYSAVGGGFTNLKPNSDLDVLRPNDNVGGWQCYDDLSETDGGRCFVVCAKRKDRDDVMTCKTIEKIAPQHGGTVAVCPTGTFAAGGGFEDRTGANKEQDASLPTPDGKGWFCERTGNTQTGLLANACYARCCTLPEVSLLAALSARSSSSASSLSFGSSTSSLSLLPLSGSSLSGAIVSSSQQNSLLPVFSSSSSSETPPSSISFSLPQVLSSADSTPASSAGPVVSSALSSVLPVFSTSSMSAGQSSSSSTVISSVSWPSSQRAQQASSITVSNNCQPDACRRQGDAYCKKNGNLKCAEIGTAPCFVCLAEVGFMPSSSRTLHASLPIAATVETQSSNGTAAFTSSRRPVSSSVQSAARPSATPSSAPTVLQATLLAPWYPSASDAHIPLSASGPGTLGVMAAGAVSGLLWMRKRRK